MVDLMGVTTVKDSLKFWQQSATKMLGNQKSVASIFLMKTTVISRTGIFKIIPGEAFKQ